MWPITKTNQPTSRRHPYAGIWGDGIVDDGIEFQYSNPAWATIDDSELIFFAPDMLRGRAALGMYTRLHTHLVDALAHQVWRCICLLPRIDPVRWSAASLLRQINDTVSHANLNATNLLSHGTNLAPGWVGKVQHRQMVQAPSSWTALFFEKVDLKRLASCEQLQLRIITLLSKSISLLNCNTTRTEPSHVPVADLALLAIHSALNPAWLFPNCRNLQDDLTAACWVGMLLRGRSALLSPNIAMALIRTLDTESAVQCQDAKDLHAVVQRNADITFGTKRLFSIATECLKTGSVALVNSRSRRPCVALIRCAAIAAEFDEIHRTITTDPVSRCEI